MLSILMAFYTIEDRNMKKLFSIFTILAAIMLTSSCQKELPDAVKNIDVSQGEKTPSPTPTPASELKVSEPGQFGAKGGDQTMTVTATAAWTISKSAESDWLTIKLGMQEPLKSL